MLKKTGRKIIRFLRFDTIKMAFRAGSATNSTQSGFSMVQVAVILSIIAITMAGFLSNSASRERRIQYVKTEEKMKRIIDALRQRILSASEPGGTALTGGIPCPAAPVPRDDASFGITDCAFEPWGTLTDYRIGVVPVRELGLAMEDAFDAWGNYLTYVANDTSTTQAAFRSSGQGTITVQNGGPGSTNVTNAVVVLISHGDSGIGAWQENVTATRIAKWITDPNIMRNIDCGLGIEYATTGINCDAPDKAYIKLPFNFSDSKQLNAFGQVVMQENKCGLLKQTAASCIFQ